MIHRTGRTISVHSLYKTRKSTQNQSSNFGLIEFLTTASISGMATALSQLISKSGMNDNRTICCIRELILDQVGDVVQPNILVELVCCKKQHKSS